MKLKISDIVAVKWLQTDSHSHLYLILFSCGGRKTLIHQHKRLQDCAVVAVPLNDGANIANSCDEERNCLEEEVYEVVVLPMDKIIASAKEKECRESQLQCVESVHSTRNYTEKFRSTKHTQK